MITLIRFIAFTMAVTGCYELYPDFGFEYLKLTFFVILNDPHPWEFLKYFPLTILLNHLLPGAILVAAYGLSQLRPWAWKLAVGTLSFDLILRVIGSFNYVIQIMQFANKPIPPIPKDATVQTFSMWPIYIIGLVCGISILILIQPPVKELFKEHQIEQNA